MLENEHDSQFEDYRDDDHEDRTKHFNNKFSKLTVHQKLKQLFLNGVGMDATTLYPSAMWAEKSVYPKIESGFLKPHMNVVYVAAFNDQTFNQDDKETQL